MLRSALRTLVSQGSATQRPFVQHVRQRLVESAPPLTPPAVLFPDGALVSPECKAYLPLTRCVFSSKLALESLAYLIHFVDAVRLAGARWSDGSDLEGALDTFGGDVVQAVQALKEARPEPTAELKGELARLLAALGDCRSYCREGSLAYPFSRAERQVRDVFGHLFGEEEGSAALPGSSSVGASSREVIAVDRSKRGPVEEFDLGPFRMPRLFNGFWQLSSPAWGSGTARSQEEALVRLVEAGLVAADMADHYGDAELIYGDFRNRLAPEVKSSVYAATKWCIFSPPDQPVTHDWVLAAVKERCRRLGGRVELLQFHWYDYAAKDYLDILVELVKLPQSHPDLVSAIGLCNFDAEHVEEACNYLVEKTGSVGLVSNQIQFSVIDSRPLQKMCGVCTKFGLQLLTYGSFCGGFLSTKWLGQPTPEIYSETTNLTPSQRKYLDVINSWGNWADFQALLRALASVAEVHGVSLTNVATRWVLQKPAVGAVIIGTRLGVSAHDDENLAVFGVKLSEVEVQTLDQAALGSGGEKSLAIFQKLGDCGNEYRAMH